MEARMKEWAAARKRRALERVLKWAGFLLALGVAATLYTYIASLPREEDWGHIDFYDPVNLGEEGSDPSMLVVQQNGLFGYTDRSGRIVIPCQFDAARPFHEGLAAVRKKHKWGYIDPSGKTVIPFLYYDADGFHDGRAFVAYRAKHADRSFPPKAYVLIDRKGRRIREVGWWYVIGYREGTYLAEEHSTHAYFDTGGNLLMKKEIEGLLFYPIEDLDRDGRYANDFTHITGGLAKVFFITNDHGSGAYFMDRQGNHVLGDFLNANEFSEGLAAVQPGDPKAYAGTGKAGLPWGYIDTKGKTVLPAIYTEAFPFGEGLAIVKKQDGQWAVIDRTGRETAMQETIEWAEAFQEGMCAVGIRMSPGALHDDQSRWGTSNVLWGFVDTTGKVVIPIQFDRVSDFHGGIAEVRIGEKIGYIDKTGKYIWELQ